MEIVVDYEEVALLAAAAGRTVDDVLRAFRQAGATGVGLPEDSLPSLLDTGRAGLRPSPAAGELQVYVPTAELAQRITRNLAAKWVTPRLAAGPNGGFVLALSGSLERLAQVGVGWDPARVAEVRGAGLMPIARPVDSPVVNENALHQVFEEIRAAGMWRVLFMGKFVLGYERLLPVTAELIGEHGMEFYAVELDVQRGTTELARLLRGRVVRTHSIGEKELSELNPQTAMARFRRAVRERNIRCCFVRMFVDRAIGDPLEANLDYLRLVSQSIRDAGFELGQAAPFAPFAPARGCLAAVALGGAGLLALLAFELFLLSARGAWVVLGAAVVFAEALSLGGEVGRSALALAVALAAPTVALLRVRLDIPPPSGPVRPSRALLRACGLVLCVSAVSLAGGALVAALLSDTPHMMKVSQFRGVKLSQLAPPLVVAAMYLLGAFPNGRGVRDQLRGAVRRARELCAAPFVMGYTLVALVLLAGAAYWVLRTGNAPRAATAGAERAVREALEQLLVFRPRTKEFLLGHPALLLGGFLRAVGRPRYVIALAIVGAVGQVSMVNTFCHIHTPIAATVLRTGYGLALGVVLGVLACLAVHSASVALERLGAD